MTDNQLAKELHETEASPRDAASADRNVDALLSLAPRLSAKQKRKRSLEIMATALNGWNARTQTSLLRALTARPRGFPGHANGGSLTIA
jgi:hypothetical protein